MKFIVTAGAKHANNLRYVDVWGRWLTWDGTRWQFDDTLAAYDLVRETCRTASAECNRENVAAALASAKTVAAVERLARSDRRLAATVDQWDVDPWLLNTPGGIVNLRSGKKSAHRAKAYMTKITAVAPQEGPTTVWKAFLRRVTGGDDELQAFLRRMAGYSLTASTKAHALFFLYGVGANGKSTFINALTGCLGEYHRTAPIETFIASKQVQHPTDLAGLRGARLVTAVETEEGRRWNESKIKTLTGGDKIAARFMRQDFFEFVPQFKLLFAGKAGYERPSRSPSSLMAEVQQQSLHELLVQQTTRAVPVTMWVPETPCWKVMLRSTSTALFST